MASVRKEIHVDAGAEVVWHAVRDFGALHERLAKGFVVDTELDGSDRIVTFANGAVQREDLLSQVMDAGAAAMKQTLDG
jgi:hypothetical protein